MPTPPFPPNRQTFLVGDSQLILSHVVLKKKKLLLPFLIVFIIIFRNIYKDLFCKASFCMKQIVLLFKTLEKGRILLKIKKIFVIYDHRKSSTIGITAGSYECKTKNVATFQ